MTCLNKINGTCITIWLHVTGLYFVSPATFLFLFQARAWISNIICRGLFMFNDLRWEVTVRFVDIGGIVDRHCLYKYCHTGWLFVFLILVELLTVIVYINIVIQVTVRFVDIVRIVDRHCLYKYCHTGNCSFCWYWWNCWPSLFI